MLCFASRCARGYCSQLVPREIKSAGIKTNDKSPLKFQRCARSEPRRTSPARPLHQQHFHRRGTNRFARTSPSETPSNHYTINIYLNTTPDNKQIVYANTKVADGLSDLSVDKLTDSITTGSPIIERLLKNKDPIKDRDYIEEKLDLFWKDVFESGIGKSEEKKVEKLDEGKVSGNDLMGFGNEKSSIAYGTRRFPEGVPSYESRILKPKKLDLGNQERLRFREDQELVTKQIDNLVKLSMVRKPSKPDDSRFSKIVNYCKSLFFNSDPEEVPEKESKDLEKGLETRYSPNNNFLIGNFYEDSEPKPAPNLIIKRSFSTFETFQEYKRKENEEFIRNIEKLKQSTIQTETSESPEIIIENPNIKPSIKKADFKLKIKGKPKLEAKTPRKGFPMGSVMRNRILSDEDKRIVYELTKPKPKKIENLKLDRPKHIYSESFHNIRNPKKSVPFRRVTPDSNIFKNFRANHFSTCEYKPLKSHPCECSQPRARKTKKKRTPTHKLLARRPTPCPRGPLKYEDPRPRCEKPACDPKGGGPHNDILCEVNKAFDGSCDGQFNEYFGKGNYKNKEYYSYRRSSFYDILGAMRDARNKQPSSNVK